MLIKEDGTKDYERITLTSADLVPDSNPARWEKTVVLVPGIIKTSIQEDPLNSGHHYTLAEVDGGDYHYDFTTEDVQPMLLNGVMVYTGDTDGKQDLTGTNILRSSLNLRKVVDNPEDADPDQLFAYNITFGVSGEDHIWFSGNDGTEKPMLDVTGAEAEIYQLEEGYAYSPDTGKYTGTYNGQPYTLYAADDGTGGRAYSGYYSKEAGAVITVKIKAGWNLEFINLPTGTTYSIEETPIPDGYDLKSIRESSNPDDHVIQHKHLLVHL